MKKIKYIIFTIALILVMPLIYAEGNLEVGDYTFGGKDGINEEKTASYEYETNTLTLNNYNGSQISYHGEEPLNIILKGNNRIEGNYYEDGEVASYFEGDGIDIWETCVTFSGEGTLEIADTSNALYCKKGTLTIDSNIKITNPTYNGIRHDEGNIVINGKVSMDSDHEYIKEKAHQLFVYTGINAGNGNITVNGDLTIKNAQGGLTTKEKIDIKSGNIIIETKSNAIDATKEITISGGNINIELKDFEVLEFTSPKIKYGIVSGTKLDITGGNINIKVLDNSIPLGVSDKDQKAVLNIGENIQILPKELEKVEIYDNLKKDYIITISNKDAKVEYLDKSFKPTITNGIKEITLKEYTYEITEGQESTYEFNKVDKYKITINGDYSLFESLSIKGLTLIKDEDYIVTEGSTIIEFTDKGIAKLNTLEKGTYDVIVKYTNNKEITSKLIIEKEEVEDPNPNTGTKILTYLIIFTVSILGLALCIKIFNKQK